MPFVIVVEGWGTGIMSNDYSKDNYKLVFRVCNKGLNKRFLGLSPHNQTKTLSVGLVCSKSCESQLSTRIIVWSYDLYKYY